MIKALVFHFKSAIKNLYRHLTVTMLSISGVTLLLVLIGTFMVISTSVGKITSGISKNISIQAAIDSTVKGDEIQKLKQEITKINGISKVEYKTKHEELETFIKNSRNGEEHFGQFRGEQNPLRDVFYVELKESNALIQSKEPNEKQVLKDISDQIAKIKGIVRVEYGGSTTEKVVDLLGRIKWVGYIVTSALILISVVLIQNTIKSTIHSRKDEIAIMRNVGASNWFIKVPFLFEGIILGLLGSIVPSLLVVFGYPSMYTLLSSQNKILQVFEPYPYIYYIIAALACIGMIIGFIGSWFSVSKYLRFKR